MNIEKPPAAIAKPQEIVEDEKPVDIDPKTGGRWQVAYLPGSERKARRRQAAANRRKLRKRRKVEAYK